MRDIKSTAPGAPHKAPGTPHHPPQGPLQLEVPHAAPHACETQLHVAVGRALARKADTLWARGTMY